MLKVIEIVWVKLEILDEIDGIDNVLVFNDMKIIKFEVILLILLIDIFNIFEFNELNFEVF